MRRFLSKYFDLLFTAATKRIERKCKAIMMMMMIHDDDDDDNSLTPTGHVAQLSTVEVFVISGSSQ